MRNKLVTDVVYGKDGKICHLALPIGGWTEEIKAVAIGSEMVGEERDNDKLKNGWNVT